MHLVFKVSDSLHLGFILYLKPVTFRTQVFIFSVQSLIACAFKIRYMSNSLPMIAWRAVNPQTNVLVL